jgi:lipoprotein-anchoring transpeptidase ErfK/SrfK
VTRLAGALVLLAAGWAASTAQAAPAAPVKPIQRLAALLRTHDAFAQPTRASKPLGRVPARRPLTGTRTVLPVLGETTRAHAVAWLHVSLPGRPNGRTGWIRRDGTVAKATSRHIVIDLSLRRVRTYIDGRVAETGRAVVGKPGTPTPRGRFFVEEVVRLPAGQAGGPIAFALSARSNVLQEFDGGPGQIALHGRSMIGGVLGSAASHGCVRVAERMLQWLNHRVGPGVPVTIRS